MEGDKGESNCSGGGETLAEKKKKNKTVSKEEAEEALKKCLEENKGDHTKCKAKIEAFESSSSQNPPSPPRRPVGPFRRKRGSLTDV